MRIAIQLHHLETSLQMAQRFIVITSI